MSFTRGTADQLTDDYDYVVLEITRQSVQAGNIASTLEKLHALTDTRENVMKYRDRVIFSVQGYDHDPRELAHIPEVRSFFKAVTDQWPYWVWFLSRQAESLMTMMVILTPTVPAKGKAGQVGYAVDTAAMAEILEDLLCRSHVLFETFDIALQDVQESLNTAFDVLTPGWRDTVSD